MEETYFPSDGSNHTQAHTFSNFRFKTYAPIAFRYFRDLFGIKPDDFLVCMYDFRLDLDSANTFLFNSRCRCAMCRCENSPIQERVEVSFI